MVEEGGQGKQNTKKYLQNTLMLSFYGISFTYLPALKYRSSFLQIFPLFIFCCFFLNLYLYFYFRKWNEIEIWVVGAQSDSDSALIFFEPPPPSKNPFENQKNQRWKNSWSRNTLPLPTRDASKISRALLARIINLFFCHASFFAGIQITFFCGFFFSVVHFKPTSLWGEKLAQTFIQRTYVRNEPQFGTKDRSNWNMRPRRVHLHAFAFALVFILIHT